MRGLGRLLRRLRRSWLPQVITSRAPASVCHACGLVTSQVQVSYRFATVRNSAGASVVRLTIIAEDAETEAPVGVCSRCLDKIIRVWAHDRSQQARRH
jgi:hypothetical protein